MTRSRARRPPHEPLAEWERDLLEGDKKDDAEVQASAETEKAADAEPAEAAAETAEVEAAAESAEAKPAAESSEVEAAAETEQQA